MERPKHILLCGDAGVGKSTLIAKLLQQNTRPVGGFVTKRLAEMGDGFHPIYIHPAATPPTQRMADAHNLIGTCNRKIHNIRSEVFDSLGTQYLTELPKRALILMDELGFMESSSPRFCEAVMQALSGELPVLAAVKSRFDVPFLNAVRAHENACVYTVTAKNRDALAEELLPVILAWNALP